MDKGEELAGYESVCYLTGGGDVGRGRGGEDEVVLKPEKSGLKKKCWVLCCCSSVGMYQIKNWCW